jgi:hypothetical protein
MQVLRCNQPTYFDVDDTLVKWGYAGLPVEGSIAIECEGFVQHLVPHKKHIDQLKAHKARGHTIVVWSQGGDKWAEAVVKALNLEEYVDLVIEKPQWYYDDLPASAFMPKPIYYQDE